MTPAVKGIRLLLDPLPGQCFWLNLESWVLVLWEIRNLLRRGVQPIQQVAVVVFLVIGDLDIVLCGNCTQPLDVDYAFC